MAGREWGGSPSIRTRLILVIGAILLAGFLTTNLISFRVSTSALKATILQNELPLTSSNIYSEIQADLLKPVFVSSLMSNDTFLKDWLINGERDVDKITRYLREIRDRYGVFTSYVVSAQTNRYYHFSGLAQVVDERDPEDFWFFRVRNLSEPYEINIDYNRAQSDALTIFVNYRLLDYDGQLLAVVGVGLKLDGVAGILARYSDNYKRNIYFADGSGMITVRSPGATTTERNLWDAPGLSAIATEVLRRDIGYFEYDRDGETMLLTTRRVPELGWVVMVEQREADALRNLWSSFLTNSAIGLAVIVLTMITISIAVSVYQKRLEVMATTDKLTGLANRQMFDHALDQAVRLRRRSGRPMSLILFDIDHFKRLNDSQGHLRGDTAIQRVADIARRVVRQSDLLCRWGGEELIVLAHECSLADAVEVAEKLRCAVAAEPLFQPDDGTRLTISVGVAEMRSEDEVDDVLARCDAALYRAKNAGRNRVELENDSNARVLIDA